MKMRAILNNIGAVSKQMIVGGAITVATVAVGIGLINNFSSKGNVEHGFASNAIERSGYSYNSAYEGASAEDILFARDFAQGQGDGKVAIRGAENLAFNKKSSAGANGAGTSVKGEAGEVGTVQDNTQDYGDGQIEGMGTSRTVAVDVTKEDAAALKAKRDAKIAQGKDIAQQTKAAFKTSKMADSSTFDSMAQGSTSMSYGTGSGAMGATGTADSSKIDLAKATGLANVDLKGAKDGRLSAMGSKNTETKGSGVGRNSYGQHAELQGDLVRARQYSASGKKAVTVSDMEKGAADAAAAFDGSKDSPVAQLEGENLQAAALSNLKNNAGEGMDFDLSGLEDKLDDVEETMQKYNDILGKIQDCMMAMILTASIASLAISILAKTGVPWAELAALVLAAAATAAIVASQIAATVYVSQLADLANSSGIETIRPSGWDWAAPWVIGGLLDGCVWASWALTAFGPTQLAQKAFDALVGLVGTAAGGGLTTSLSHFFGKMGKKK